MPTPKRKGWETLSADYRARLEKNGVTKGQYESGASIKAARGHKATPERPANYNQTAFPTYASERNALTDRVAAKKHYFFSSAPKWNPRKARERFASQPPPLRLLRQWASYTREEWMDALRTDTDAVAYLGYH